MMIEGVLYGSRVSGPGTRNVLVLRGCTHKCPGCINEDLWSFTASTNTIVTEHPGLVTQILLAKPCDGITITGGEPLYWFTEGLFDVLVQLKDQGIPVIIFTGFSKGEILSSPVLIRVLDLCDVLVTGRFIKEKRITVGLRGSSNQEILVLTPKYTLKELEEFPQEMEFHCVPNVLIGFPPTTEDSAVDNIWR